MMKNDDLSTEVSRLLQDFPGTPRIVIRDIQSDISFDRNAQQVFPRGCLASATGKLRCHSYGNHVIL
jgi:hypothetical protein